jgi:hypothetical protein
MELYVMRNMAEVNYICCYRIEKKKNGSPLVLLHKNRIRIIIINPGIKK